MRIKNFVFRKNANIGAADAVEDRKFLEQSFIDNGSIDVLTDMSNPQCIVLGRTGSGKTALLERINDVEERVIKISPEGLALNYISSNNVLRFFREVGVNLDLFYRLLWRHVFAVELIRERYQIINEQQNNNFWMTIRQVFILNPKKRHALEYLRQYGESFWKDSEFRVQEITKTLENDLTRALDVSASPLILDVGTGFSLNVGTAKKLTEEQKGEIIHRGEEVVNKVQMQTLSTIIEMLETDLLDDKKKKYYITIDRLDENWIHDEFRYGLIKALIETARDFNRKVGNVKIIMAVREDLLDRVFRYTRKSGDQEEKFRSTYMSLSWTRPELQELLDRRVTQLIKEQYTTQPVKLADLFPKQIQKTDSLTYFFDRTLMRPRDAILFFNECIKAAEGQAKFTPTLIQQAEDSYSTNRLRALADEWSADYTNLFELTMFLKRYTIQFRPSDLHNNIEERALKFLTSELPEDEIHHLVMSWFNSGDTEGLIQEVLRILFRVGVVGIKPEQRAAFLWAHLGQKLNLAELSEHTQVKIHPAFWRVLNIYPA